jgi:hypothetical protein
VFDGHCKTKGSLKVCQEISAKDNPQGYQGPGLEEHEKVLREAKEKTRQKRKG